MPVRLFAAADRWAAETPSAVAFTASDGTLDFRGQARQFRVTAAALAAAGAGAGTMVGVATGRSCYAPTSLLAAWWLGATAVLLDERHPAERLNFVLDDAGVEVLLATEEFATTTGLIRVDPVGATENPAPPPAAGDLAYLVYTSGTTGRPKGVEVTYRGLDLLVAALAELSIPPGGLGVNALSPAFDGWLWCTLLHLLHGQGTAIIDLAADDTDLAGHLAAIKPRTVCLTPSLLATCTDALSTVELVVTAGERCPGDLAERLATGRRMLNVYGPTETTIAATWADTACGDDPVTIGRALPGYRTFVLDEHRCPVLPGTPGELYVGGPALARGYRNQPALTADRFGPVPGIAGGERLYRTGDLVSARPDGQLDYLGRTDDQVKVRGFRIELAEVEQVVEELPAITSAAAFVLESGAALGIAAVVAPGNHIDAGAIREHCLAKLPGHAVPSVVDLVLVLPTTGNGKVDRDALSQASGATGTGGGRAPSTPRESEVCAAWSELLERPVVDVDADFFELGGHSLLAAQAVAALRRSTGIRFSITVLLSHPTPAKLARELDRRTGTATGSGTGRPGSWLVTWHPEPARRPTLLCLPHGGAGCGRYRPWQERLGDRVSVVGVQLPGRENRWPDKHPDTLADAAEAVVAEVAGLIEPAAPLVVFGESFGGLLGYEVARRLGERGRPPVALVVAASEPPHEWASTHHDYGSEAVLHRLLDAGSATVRDLDRDTRNYVLTLLRRDGALAATFDLPPEHRLDFAVHAWGGDADELVTAASLDGWSGYTTREFARRQFDGGHMFGTELSETTLPALAKLLGVPAC
ncbi:AMP-binding protein [Amycolatopsis jejuensis]|uniref:AMP-binding protein n=1 Tax=Amycolatopsis jejuensis TaxID=330084 RepID=UPI0007C470F0|nr:AMP-binding protein [Amycolatopsis jejuensis]